MQEKEYIRELRSRLAAREPRVRLIREFRHGAVIVPIVEDDGRVGLLFEVRSAHLSRHAGLISFPGGSIEDGETPLQAALREMEEEVGSGRGYVDLLGELDTVEGLSGDRISSFLCAVRSGYRLVIQQAEVQKVFIMPLEFLLAQGLKEGQMVQEFHPAEGFPAHLLPQGTYSRRYTHPVPYLEYQDNLIWGLTARIVGQLVDLLR